MLGLIIGVVGLLLPLSSSAKILEPVTWEYRGASTVDVKMACFWFDQFPDRDDDLDRHLVLVCPSAMWAGFSVAKQQAIQAAFIKLLKGEVKVNRANLATWKNRFTDAGIATDLVLPDESPSIGAKLYLIIVPKTKSASRRLNELGLYAKEPEE